MLKKILIGLGAVVGGALLQEKYDVVGKSKSKIKSWVNDDEKKDAAAPAAEESKED
jgi:hypothetical protein